MWRILGFGDGNETKKHPQLSHCHHLLNAQIRPCKTCLQVMRWFRCCACVNPCFTVWRMPGFGDETKKHPQLNHCHHLVNARIRWAASPQLQNLPLSDGSVWLCMRQRFCCACVDRCFTMWRIPAFGDGDETKKFPQLKHHRSQFPSQ